MWKATHAFPDFIIDTSVGLDLITKVVLFYDVIRKGFELHPKVLAFRYGALRVKNVILSVVDFAPNVETTIINLSKVFTTSLNTRSK